MNDEREPDREFRWVEPAYEKAANLHMERAAELRGDLASGELNEAQRRDAQGEALWHSERARILQLQGTTGEER